MKTFLVYIKEKFRTFEQHYYLSESELKHEIEREKLGYCDILSCKLIFDSSRE